METRVSLLPIFPATLLDWLELYGVKKLNVITCLTVFLIIIKLLQLLKAGQQHY